MLPNGQYKVAVRGCMSGTATTTSSAQNATSISEYKATAMFTQKKRTTGETVLVIWSRHIAGRDGLTTRRVDTSKTRRRYPVRPLKRMETAN